MFTQHTLVWRKFFSGLIILKKVILGAFIAILVSCDEAEQESSQVVSERSSSPVSSRYPHLSQLRGALRNNPAALGEQLQVIDNLELRRSLNAIYGTTISDDIEGYLQDLANLSDKSLSQRLRVALLRVLVTRDIPKALELLSKMQKDNAPPEFLKDLVFVLADRSAEDLSHFLNKEGSRFNLSMESIMADYYARDNGLLGKWPSNFFGPEKSKFSSLGLSAYLNQSGGPESRKDLFEWLEGSSFYGEEKLGVDAASLHAKHSPEDAKDLLSSSVQILRPSVRRGLIEGLASSNPNDAASLAQQLEDGPELIQPVMMSWFEQDLSAAGEWINRLEHDAFKKSAVVALVDWLRKENYSSEAAEWQSLLSLKLD